jgi:YihY family inner membrane protein
MDLLAPLRAFDRLQQRHRALAFPVAVFKKFGEDQAGNLAALIAYRAFFSLFPLLLVFTTILGFVLQGDPSARRAVLHSTLRDFPVVGGQLQAGVHPLSGSSLALGVGIALALWAGLGVTLAAQNAMDRVWEVPFKHRRDFLFSRLQGLGLLAALGALNLISTAASGLVSGGYGEAWLTVAGIGVSLLLNLVLFSVAFRLLTARTVATGQLVPGIVIAAVAWGLLQALGGYYVGHAVKAAGPTYGTFALVIGLLTWLHLGAMSVMYAAEANVVRVHHLWPRSLFGVARPEDEKTLRALAKVEERDHSETVDVRFGDDGGAT